MSEKKVALFDTSTADRIVRAVRAIEGTTPESRRSGHRTPAACEVQYVRVTSDTIDDDGNYPGIPTWYLVGSGTWEDATVAVKVKPAAGETLTNGTRYPCLPAGENEADEPVYITLAGAMSELGEVRFVTLAEGPVVEGWYPGVITEFSTVTNTWVNTTTEVRFRESSGETLTGGVTYEAVRVGDYSGYPAYVVYLVKYVPEPVDRVWEETDPSSGDPLILYSGSIAETLHWRIGVAGLGGGDLQLRQQTSGIGMTMDSSGYGYAYGDATWRVQTNSGASWFELTSYDGVEIGAVVNDVTDQAYFYVGGNAGGTATTGGLTFVGGLYISGTFSGGGSGTVTSVGLSLPSIFSVTVSPITSSGDLTAVLATQSANTGFFGPTSGSAAAPTFRAMVLNDLPTLAANRLWGNPTGSSAKPVEIPLGTGLFFSSGSLVAATGGDVYGPASSPLDGFVVFDGNTGKIIKSLTPSWDAIIKVATSGICVPYPAQEFMLGLMNSNTAADCRTNLGLGSLATASSVGTSEIADDAVTYAKLQNVSATSRVLGRKTSGAGNAEECTLSEVLDMVGSAAQGDILYRGASTWTRLGAGTAGQVLQSGGTGANPSWTTPASGVSAATDAEMEAASSTSVYVSPGRLDRHPSVVKAWVNFNGTGTPAIRTSRNVTSLTDNGTGDYTVNLSITGSSADWCAHTTNNLGICSLSNVGTALASTSVRVRCRDAAAVLTDTSIVCVSILGDV